ncbi:hypothetical protein Ae706Ps2_4521 [Pseudonocardia sp. Ae706_Ps2]|nr:hypothetical protein Ae331Ps2_1434c [Pseudonocardia sp. Ae331_Ps2]OLM10649.1 hypothetical protein Ae505Ps2_0772c [Pseudonocardia sp. Ae505_Ps2]OLM26088.1 hypothetical protein Ae706Ps2_4521 [Pseudonocardia sp. Ae706_Ps2]
MRRKDSPSIARSAHAITAAPSYTARAVRELFHKGGGGHAARSAPTCTDADHM